MPQSRRSLRVAAVLLAGAAALSPFPSSAESLLKPGIIGDDNRQPVDNSAPPWTAIGQVNVGGFRKRTSCTGTLIAPRLVLTAAHCLLDWEQRAVYPMRDIHFAAGVRRDAVLGQSAARCVKFPEGVRFPRQQQDTAATRLQRPPIATSGVDLALIVLADDIPRAGTIAVLKRDVFRDGLPLIHASYPADRRFVLMADRSCKTVSRGADLWATSCSTYPASSGGPVLTEADGGLKIAAVMVGANGNTATFAVPLASWPGMPLTAECP